MSEPQQSPLDAQIDSVRELLISTVCAALGLYQVANTPQERMQTAQDLYAGRPGNGEAAPQRGLADQWKELSGLNTTNWRDLPHWQFLVQTISIIADSRPKSRGWRAAWPEIARRLRELHPQDDTFAIYADLQDRANVLRGTAPQLPDVRPLAPEATTTPAAGPERAEGVDAGSDQDGTKKDEEEDKNPQADTSSITTTKEQPKQLDSSVRKAYLAFQYAESKQGKRLEDRQAYTLLKEEGFAENAGDLGELADYKLPAFDTWTRYLRDARRAFGDQKYSSRRGRRGGKSIVKSNEIERLKDDHQ